MVIITHCQNVLETLDTFVAAAEGNRDTRNQVLLAATKTIFDANQSGYLSTKTNSSDSASQYTILLRKFYLPSHLQTVIEEYLNKLSCNPSIGVYVNGVVTRIGMHERVDEDTELHFLPAISGGVAGSS